MTSPETQKTENDEKRLKIFSEALESFTDEMVEDFQKHFEAFTEGRITPAEFMQIPRETILQLSQYGYLQFQRNQFKKAESIFQGLAVLDPKNPYHHMMLGTIYYRTDEWLEAATQYSMALELDPNDLASRVYRGEIYYKMGYNEEPLADFEETIRRDPEGRDPWANRARFLKEKLLEEMKNPMTLS